MKPQCNTSADCLRELARVMEQFGIFNTTDAINSCYVKYCGKSSYGMRKLVPDFFTPSDWQFAIAEVEGKPVFIGDKLYHHRTTDEPRTITHVGKSVHGDLCFFSEEAACFCKIEEATWNPPKPNTVMVEIRTEVAERYVKHIAYIQEMSAAMGDSVEIAQSCKKALEQIK